MNEPQIPDDNSIARPFEFDLRSWEEETQKRKEIAKSNLMRVLAERPDIANVQVEYDGSCDSGCCEKIKYLDLDGKDFSAEELNDSVEEYAFAMLPEGWEINDGSYGTILIDVTSSKAQVIHTERVMEEYTVEFEI